jgi:transposase-like protein
MARYGEAFRNRAVARLLPPESAQVGVVSQEIGVSVQTLERWREDAQSRPARGRAWTARARLEAVITAAAMDEAGKSAWCREHGVYPAETRSVVCQRHRGLGRARGGPRQSANHPARQEADQGARTRTAAQRPGAGRNGSSTGPVKKSRGDLQQGRGRMIGLEDRQALGPRYPCCAGGRRALEARLRDGRHQLAHAATLASWRRPCRR